MSEIFQDVFGNAVELTEERWRHILLHHPIMERYRARIAEVLMAPNVVQQCDFNPNEFRYYRRYDDLWNASYDLSWPFLLFRSSRKKNAILS